ncbi:MAG: alpha/beta hydrolase fold domain-containing protein [Caldilineaceae bacterium]
MSGQAEQPQSIPVSLSEWTIDMPTALPPGPTVFIITNDGTIDHSFAIGGAAIQLELSAELAPGESDSLEVDLAPGEYYIYCPIDDHATQGMELMLTVSEDAAASSDQTQTGTNNVITDTVGMTQTVDLMLTPSTTMTNADELTELPAQELPTDIVDLMTQPLTEATPTVNMQAVLDQLAAFEAPPIPELSARVARQVPTPANAVAALLVSRGESLAPEPVASVTHQLIPGPGGNILARVFTPEGDGPFPVIVYYHGGGWVIAGLDAYEASMRALANAADAIVVGVAYRQAPEHRFPAAVEDAYVAYQWVLDNADTINGDAARVAVAGESAGGNLAAVVSQIARDRGDQMPVYQLLVYPVAQQVSDTTPSYEANANAVPLNRAAMHWFIQRYLASPEDATSPYASPLLAADLSGLPDATVITAEIDPLRSEGEAYAMRLQEAGVDVTYRNFEGVTHEFFGMGAVLPEARQAVSLAGQELQAAFGTGETTTITETTGITNTTGSTNTTGITNTTGLTSTTGPTGTTGITNTTGLTNTTSMTSSMNIGMIAGTGPENAAALTGQFTTIGPNEMQWYRFSDTGDGNRVDVRLTSPTDGRLGFEVWTEQQLNQWRDGVEFDPLGAGTPNSVLDSDLSWRGSFNNSGTYYVVVRQTNPAAGEDISYSIEVTGPGVSTP